MPKIRPIYWGAAIMAIALLNIIDVLPDWTTLTAILTAPFFFAVTGARCSLAPKDAR
jgi:hypothetical protein